jgi:hypothetical protein
MECCYWIDFQILDYLSFLASLSINWLIFFIWYKYGSVQYVNIESL